MSRQIASYAIGEKLMKLENKKYRNRSGLLPWIELAVGTYFLGMVVFALSIYNFVSIPFLLLFVLGAICVGVLFMNPKRTHLD